MKIGMLGTGEVGRTLASRLVEVGHEVRMGSRTADGEAGRAWVEAAGEGASQGTFADAATFGEVVFLCVKGEHALAVLESAGGASLEGKVLVDVSNPLDFSQGFPPSLTVCNDDSLGEQVQRAHPKARVVKALNTMWNGLMARPRLIEESHQTFVSGDDDAAKATVRGLLTQFGWRDEEILDLGDITTARGTEMYLPLWVRIYGATQTGAFNMRLVKAHE